MAAKPNLEVSLAAWSMHRLFYAAEIDQLGMLQMCHQFGIKGFELVNRFFPSPQYGYLRRLQAMADDMDIRLLVIMCDDEGDMVAPEKAERLQAARNHFKWVDVADVLGCHSIRCNVRGEAGDVTAMGERAAESFGALLDYAAPAGINVLIENHGGLSSDADWLVSLMEAVGHPLFGTLPDFGGFPPEVDRYEAVRKLMPWATAVSAKCYDFGPDGNDLLIDFSRMFEIIRDANYSGFIGIEYEGDILGEREGIAAAHDLIRRLI